MWKNRCKIKYNRNGNQVFGLSINKLVPSPLFSLSSKIKNEITDYECSAFGSYMYAKQKYQIKSI